MHCTTIKESDSGQSDTCKHNALKRAVPLGIKEALT